MLFQWRIQKVWDNLPPEMSVATLRYKYVPFLVLIEVATEIEMLKSKQCFTLC